MDHPGLSEVHKDLAALAAGEIDHAVLIIGDGGKVEYANRAFHEMFGYSAAELIGISVSDLLAKGLEASVIDRIRRELGAGRHFVEELPIMTKAGTPLWVSTAVKPIYDARGAVSSYLLVYSNISDSKLIQQLQRDVLAAIARDCPIGEVMDLITTRVEIMAPEVVCSILAVDADRRLRSLSAPQLPASFCAAVNGLAIGPKAGSCGTAAWRGEPVVVEDIETDPLWDDYKSLPLPIGLLACWSSPITLRDGRVGGTFAFYYREKRGPSVWHEYIVKACVDLCVVALERDAANAHIARLAYYDSLTGLPNRAKLREEMEARIDRAESPRDALLFLDLDNFKDVNDTLGHSVGDNFLVQIANRLQGELWSEDLICRHGGDEFVVVLAGADESRARKVAERLLVAIGEPVRVDGVTLPASVSIGISLCPEDGSDSATLLRNADMAMYSAKGEGRGTFRFFNANMNRDAQDRLLLGALLRDAVGRGQIRLAYQPQIDARTGAIAGVEALARWSHPALGDIPPGRFIPLAEDCGLIEAIGDFCLKESCRQLRAWDDSGHDIPQVAVNVSSIQFRNPLLPKMVADALNANGIEPGRLTLEVTESVMMDAYPVAAENAAMLREMGVTISMDDFGTGYSSLSHLARLPVTELKIDRSFMRDLEENEAVQAMVTAVIRIGETLKLRVVAEGVETIAQRRFLEALGCDVLQGFLFAEAMPPAAFLDWLRIHIETPSIRGAA